MQSLLASGARFGKYEVRSQLGAGGMGEVYLAHDTNLERDVALKILPATVASDRQRLRRFIQEAKAASALNHPNILTIHEIEQIDSVTFIVTEFIDGETLRCHLRVGRLETAKALDISVQIASALAAVKLYYQRDWPAAERAFRRGIELNPNFAEIRHHYAVILVGLGREEEGLAEFQRAIDLDPLSVRLNANFGRTLFLMRQYDRAIGQFRQTLEMDQNSVAAHEWLGDAYEQKGMHREAIAEWRQALTLSGEGEQASMLQGAYAASGFDSAVRALWQKKLEQLNERTKRGDYVAAGKYATAYTRMGDIEQALALVGKAVQERNGSWFEFKANPVFDSLREDPRFHNLLLRVGFKS